MVCTHLSTSSLRYILLRTIRDCGELYAVVLACEIHTATESQYLVFVSTTGASCSSVVGGCPRPHCCWRRVPGVIGSWFIERRFLERRSRIDPQDPKFHRAAILLSVLRADPCTMNSKEQNAGLPKEYNTPNAPLARSWERPRSCVDTNCYKDLVRTPVPPAANMVVNGTCMIYHIIV